MHNKCFSNRTPSVDVGGVRPDIIIHSNIGEFRSTCLTKPYSDLMPKIPLTTVQRNFCNGQGE